MRPVGDIGQTSGEKQETKEGQQSKQDKTSTQTDNPPNSTIKKTKGEKKEKTT